MNVFLSSGPTEFLAFPSLSPPTSSAFGELNQPARAEYSQSSAETPAAYSVPLSSDSLFASSSSDRADPFIWSLPFISRIGAIDVSCSLRILRLPAFASTTNLLIILVL